MSYIGKPPAEHFTSFATQTFSTSATTSYTLDHAVTNENELALFVNNVRQQPGSGKAYTATGTALTLSAATATTDTMYCIFLGRALQTVTPSTNSITSSMIASKGTSHTLLATNTISSATAASTFSSTYITSDFEMYEFHILYATPATDDVNLYIYVSSDNGSSYLTGAIDQMSTRNRPGSASDAISTTDQDYVWIGSGTGNATGEATAGVVKMFNAASSSMHTYFTIQTAGKVEANDQVRSIVGAAEYDANTTLNNIKFAFSSGNIAVAKIKLYGVN